MSTMTLTAYPTRTARRAAARSTVRLTRRGRLVVFVLGLLVAVTVAVVFASVSVATGEKGEPVPTDTIVVGTGVTLWEIAASRAEDGDVRAVIEEIQQLNHLEGGMVVAGQQLRVPAS